MLGKSERVEVTIVNGDGKVLTQTTQSLEDIPERFDVQTIIDLGPLKFMIVEADPADRNGCMASGKLTLKVQPIVSMNPKDILYSLPTIAYSIGSEIPFEADGKRILVMHEDDWRQVELVSNSLSAEIAAEFSAIAKIFENRRGDGAFPTIHAREGVEGPLAGADVSLSELRGFEEGMVFDGVSFAQPGINAAQIKSVVGGGFALQVAGGMVLYGQVVKDPGGKELINALAVADAKPSNLELAATTIAQLCQEHNLVLVDWCRGLSLSGQAEVLQYFQALTGKEA
ncbi:MAG: hypothetical protein C0508_14800 [Cyanobacteria bacterium PR.023]|nr:hypothetical protein [Cyanobacteria bacterium PR.023]